MTGVMFMACIPTREYEKQLTCDETCNLIKKRASTPIKNNLKENRIEITADSSMEEVLIQLLSDLKIENYSWIPIQNEKFVHVIFCIDADSQWEESLQLLTQWGIGNKYKSTLGIIPCSMYFKGQECNNQQGEREGKSRNGDNSRSGWEEFVLSVVRSRLAVAQVVHNVKGNAKLTFDFIVLLILAGMIAAVGLIENSVVSIVASMLISPLMGPILAGTFGTVISDRKLQMLGVRNGLLGLVIAILVGYFMGLIIGAFDDYYGTDQWPTPEMMSRGCLRSLWVGVLIALPSGAGVALGLLGDNSCSVIGVAISASLLPPAVNAGLLWALSTLEWILERSTSRQLPHLFANLVYSNHLPSEYALLGCVSLSLTLINIVCIFIAGVVILRIKEVTHRTLTDEVGRFWQHDIKVTRDYNKSLSKEDARLFEKQIAEELSKGSSNNLPRNGDFLRQKLGSLLELSPDVLRKFSRQRRLSQLTWSPRMSVDRNRSSSVGNLEKLYTSLGGLDPPRMPIGNHLKVGTLSPIAESRDLSKQNNAASRFPVRCNNRFTVIPSSSDPLINPTRNIQKKLFE